MKRCFWTVPATMTVALLAALVMVMGAQAATEASPRTRAEPATAAAAGLVTQDAVALRAAPREAAPVQTLLWRGDALEIRAERGDYLQVWDHHRERGGYVRKAQVHPVGAAVDDLLAVLAFVRDESGAEALGLGLAAAAIERAPAARLAGPAGAELLDAIGQQAERLADRASSPAPRRAQEQAALSAHLDVAGRHGVRFVSHEAETRVRLCYDGDAWRRLLVMPSARSEQRARAALALTRDDCIAPQAMPAERERIDQLRAEQLDRVAVLTDLAPHWKHRVNLRRAAVHASVAYASARHRDAAAAAAAVDRAASALAQVSKPELVDDDLLRLDEAALRINAVRWAAAPAAAPSAALSIATRALQDGQTCVTLLDRRQAATAPLAERCTWGLVWAASASASREGQALALAVQPTDGWRELWVFRKAGEGWTVDVLPPAAATPGLGYAEFAGWVPGGRQMLVAREAIADGRTTRRFEVLRLDTLTAERQAFEPGVLGAFNRWPDAAWKRDSLALR